MRCGYKLVLSIVLATVSTAHADLPRYKLPVGRKISYATTRESTGRPSSKSNVELTVVRENPDGSRRVIIQSGSARQSTTQASLNVDLSYTDVFPDGRCPPKSLLDMHADPALFLAPLPKDDAEMQNGWTASNEERQQEVGYKRKSTDAKEFIFTADEGGTMNKIYQVTNRQTFHFDTQKGVVTFKTIDASQDYGFHSHITGEMKLVTDEMLPAAETTVLADDYDLLFSTRDRYTEKMRSTTEDRAHIDTIAADAKAMLDQALAKAKTPPVKGALKQLADKHDDWVSETRVDGDQSKNVLNLPSPDWSAKDIDGKAVKLADFRGKVVVMDFWYRGCGWCMYAMPQVKKLAEDFKDKGVVVLGMNADTKDEDARFVIETLGLKYPTIKAKGIPEKYGVKAFPTLILIDQQGVVRDVHVGYTPTLHKDLTKKLNALLKSEAKPAASAAGPPTKP